MEKIYTNPVTTIANLQEESDRRLALLKRCQELMELADKYIPGDLFYRDDLHDELAKELADDNDGS